MPHVLLAAGAEMTSKSGRLVPLQVTAFERWYAGIAPTKASAFAGASASRSARTAYLTLDVDARIFESDYGEDYGGRQASLPLSTNRPSRLRFRGRLGIFARREWLNADPFSSLQFGAYGGLSHCLSDDLAGGFSLGVSRLRLRRADRRSCRRTRAATGDIMAASISRPAGRSRWGFSRR